jgi:hypothetical protein
MLLKRLPDAVDVNPVKVASGIIKIVLQIKDVRRCSSHRWLTDRAFQEVEGNIDVVERRILSTVDQLRVVEEALDGWEPNNAEEGQGVKLYKTYGCLSPSRPKLTSRRPCRTLAEEWRNLIMLKKQSLGRKIAAVEEDNGRIAQIFERINQAREQLVVRICVIVVIFRFIVSPTCF